MVASDVPAPEYPPGLAVDGAKDESADLHPDPVRMVFFSALLPFLY